MVAFSGPDAFTEEWKYQTTAGQTNQLAEETRALERGDAISGMWDTLGQKFERTRINVDNRVSRQRFVRANQGPKLTPHGHVAAALPRRPDGLL